MERTVIVLGNDAGSSQHDRHAEVSAVAVVRQDCCVIPSRPQTRVKLDRRAQATTITSSYDARLCLDVCWLLSRGPPWLFGSSYE